MNPKLHKGLNMVMLVMTVASIVSAFVIGMVAIVMYNVS